MIKIFQIDAFTNKPFSGNPAGVCILEKAADEQWMQHVANEMNLAETAFLFPENDGYRLRWFTPETEVQLCGHATLASAFTLWDQQHLQHNQEAKFYTLSGKLTAKKEEDWIVLDFPKINTKKADIPEVLTNALGIGVNELYENTSGYSIVLLENEEQLRALKVDFEGLKKYQGEVVIVTAPSSDKAFDFVSRVFVPKYGINEDPVTGSAHCCLAPFWSNKLGQSEFTAYQASARGGIVKLKLTSDRVMLIGQAVKVLEGNLLY